MTAISSTDTSQNYLAPAQSGSIQPQVSELLKRIFAEVVVSAVAVGVTCLFVATMEVAISFIVVTVAILAINIFARIAAILFERYSSSSNTIEQGDSGSAAAKASKLIPPITFGLLYEITANTLVHEGGHYAAATSIFTDAAPQVVIDGLVGGKIYGAFGRQFTALGKFLGPLNSMILISAAGALAAICLATVGIVLGLALGEKHPELSKYLLFAGSFSVIQHVAVALSALTSSPLGGGGNDFLSLWYLGIHPLVSVICLIAIPAIAVLGYLLIKNQMPQSLKPIGL